MNERDEIFRERLIALMSELNTGEEITGKLRRMLGAFANRLTKDAGARDWADLKERADGPTYDSLLRLFQRESDRAHKAGDGLMERSMEVLAISLIARRQYQADLTPGITVLDKFIGVCEGVARRKNAQFIPVSRLNH